MSGIGNPDNFIRSLRLHYRVIEEMTFDDHHVYKVRDTKAMLAALERCPEAYIVTTEKDAVKMFSSKKIPEAVCRRLYYIPVKMAYIEESEKDFLQNLERDVKRN
jgi:tetraacyldisaccharide 4'-kinase